MVRLALVIHNVRSAYNVGSLLRTADGLGVEIVYITGYSPHPGTTNDDRLPHIVQKVTEQIHKTALGAEKNPNVEYLSSIDECIKKLTAEGFLIAALEQTDRAIDLQDFKPPPALGLVVGSEVDGLDQDVLAKIPTHLTIPMRGRKESFNVAVAGAIALYHMCYLSWTDETLKFKISKNGQNKNSESRQPQD